jgi:hypothetical protein
MKSHDGTESGSQLSLESNVEQVHPVDPHAPPNTNVICFCTHDRVLSRQTANVERSPEIERLLREAKRLRW